MIGVPIRDLIKRGGVSNPPGVSFFTVSLLAVVKATFFTQGVV